MSDERRPQRRLPNQSIIQSQILLPFSRFDQLANFALDQVAFECADVADVELAVEVIGFVLECTGQKIVADLLKDLSGQILGADGDNLRACHVLTKVRDAETAFTLRVAAFFANDLGVDKDEFGVWILFERDVNDGDAARDTDLRSGEADAASGIHRLEHVIDELLQFFVEDRNLLGWLLEDWISELNDGVNHLSCNQ